MLEKRESLFLRVRSLTDFLCFKECPAPMYVGTVVVGLLAYEKSKPSKQKGQADVRGQLGRDVGEVGERKLGLYMMIIITLYTCLKVSNFLSFALFFCL